MACSSFIYIILYPVLYLFPSLPVSNTLHSFYLSVTQILAEDGFLKVEHRIFLSDIEKAINDQVAQNDRIRLDLLEGEVEQAVWTYINAHFQIDSVGCQSELAGLSSLSKEGDGNFESLIVRYTIKYNPPCASNLKVFNALLIGAFDEQVNMVHYACGQKKNSKRFNKRIVSAQL